MGRSAEDVRWEAGRPAALAERLRDQERQLLAARQALEAERRRYQELFDLTPDACLVTDAQGTIEEANTAAAALLQERQCDLAGKPLAVLVAEGDRLALRNRTAALQCGECRGFTAWEIEVSLRSGLRVPVAVTAMAVVDEASNVRSLRWLLRDIRRRRQAEARLRFLADSGRELASSLDYARTLQSVAQLAVPTIADWAVVVAFGSDVDCHPSVAHRSPAKAELVRELIGCYPQGSVVLEGYDAALRGRRPYLVTRSSEAGMLGPAPSEGMRRLLAALHPVSYMVVPMVARERTLGVIFLVLAESERSYKVEDVELGAELGRRAAMAIDNARLYGEAQDAISARDQFLSAAAHELKTPITNLYGYAQLELLRLERRGAMDDPKQVRRYLEVIRHQSGRLARLVAQILDLSQIEAGTLHLRREPADLAVVARKVVAGLGAANRRRVITLQAPEQVPALIDSERVHQVLTNLIDNALKFSPAAAPVEVELALEDGQAYLSVRDYGTGVPPERRPLIFSRFFQAHTGRAFAGLGLGLYVSRHVVEAHGGHIEAAFPAEGGTRMLITLPASEHGGR